jgi:DNA polymerase I
MSRGKFGRKRLILLDAHAIIHRAYHALPDFTSPSGEPSGALYGLSSMLLRIINDLDPDYLAACYDLEGPTVRHEVYADYKGTRAKTDDALVHQLNSSRRVFEAFCIPMYDKPGFEADDILGTIVEKLKDDESLEIVIASGDMDTLQLIREGVKVYTLKKGLNDTILYDEKAVVARFGFPPELIPDYKGLRGDPSDNIKGVPGIGEKTATDLITTFGSVEEIYKALKRSEKRFAEKGIKPRIVELLKAHEEDARFSKSLAMIRRDASITFRLPDAVWKEHPDLPKIRVLFDELGFRSLRPRLDALIGKGGEEEDVDREEETEEKPETTIPPARFREAQAMLWLLHSEFTNPGLEDILAYASTRDFDEAYTSLEKKLSETGKVNEVWNDIEKPLVPVILGMEARGVKVDSRELARLTKTYRAELTKIEKRIHTAAGKEFNISSPKQLAEVLFDDLGLAAKGQKKTSTGQRSTRESELIKLRELHPIIDDVLEYRELSKLLGTYLDAIPPLLDKDNRLHATFIQTGAATGRMASQNPNLQNIPIKDERGRALRNAFIAEEGFSLVALDYSQIELRIAAILSGDEKFCEIFKEGRDVHTEVAARVFKVAPDAVTAEMRRRAKVINFGILYGMGVNSLRAALGTSTAEAHHFYEEYFTTFSTLSAYLESTKGFARTHGYTETLFGRRRQFPEMKSPLPYVRAQAERTAINAPIQGTQADIIKLAMVRISAMLEKENATEDAYLLLQIHDELVYEIRAPRVQELGEKIEYLMESVLSPKETGGVPLIAEARVGKNWGDMDKLQK